MSIYMNPRVGYLIRGASGAFKLGTEVFDLTAPGSLRRLVGRGGVGSTGQTLLSSGEAKLLADPLTATSHRLPASAGLAQEAGDVGQSGAADVAEVIGLGAREAAATSGISAEAAEVSAQAALLAKADSIAAASGKTLDEAITGSTLGQKIGMAAGDFKDKFLGQLRSATSALARKEWWRRFGALLAAGGASSAITALLVADQFTDIIPGVGPDGADPRDGTTIKDVQEMELLETRIRTVCAGSRMTPAALVALMELIAEPNQVVVKAVAAKLNRATSDRYLL